MKLSEMFPSNFLKAADVTDAGGEMDMTIFTVEMKEFDTDEGGKADNELHFSVTPVARSQTGA